MKKYLSFVPIFYLLIVSACTDISVNKKQEPVHPVVGKWAQAGKCDSIPWYFGEKSVRWGDNGGHWVDMGSKIKVTSYIAQENATMTLYFSSPQNNIMRTLSVNYGGANVSGMGGKLIKC